MTRPWPIVAIMALSQMLIVLDASVLNIAITTLADPVVGLGASSSQLGWIASSYTLIFASTLLAGGALADKFGPRTTLIAGLIIFAIASGAGAYATTPEQLIVARGFTGFGSGLLSPATLSIIVSSTPVAIRTRAIAIWGSSSGLGAAIGPVTGGLLLSQFWWGSVFLIMVPIVALCLVGVVALVPALRSVQRRVLDLPGLVLSTLGFGALVYAIIEVGQEGTFSSPSVFGPLLAGAILLVLFVLAQRRSATPSVDLRLFAQRRFAAGSLILFLAFMALSGELFVIAFYLLGPRGLSPQTAATVLLPSSAGVIIGTQLAPTATRLFSARVTVAAGSLITGIAYASFLWYDQRTPLTAIGAVLFIQGVGMNLIGTPLTVLMMTGVPPHLSGMGSAVSGVTRQVGSALGVAITSAILTAVYRQQLSPALAQLPVQAQAQAQSSAEAAQSLARSLNLPALAGAAERSYLTAMYAAAVFAALIAAAGFAVAFVGLYVRARHRADPHAAGRRRRRVSEGAQHAPARKPAIAVGGHQPPVSRDCFERWNPGGSDGSAELALNQLKIVLAIAEAGGLSAAASWLRIPRPALTQKLNRIERSFGGPLFNSPAGGRLALTELGAQVVVRARELVNQFDGPLTAAWTPDPVVERPAAVVRIGGVESPFLPIVALAVQELLPDLEQTTRVKTSSAAVLELIRTGELDLAVIADFRGLPAHQIDQFRSARLVAEPLFVGLSAQHHLAGRESIRLAELAHEAWVAPSHLDGLWLSFRLACEEAGFSPYLRHFGAGLTMTAELVRSGSVIAVLPPEVPLPKGVVRKPLAGDPLWRRMRMVWRADSPVAEVAPEIHYRALRQYQTFGAHSTVGVAG